MSKKAEGFSLRFVLINTGNISRKVLSKVLRSFVKNFERLHAYCVEGELLAKFGYPCCEMKTGKLYVFKEQSKRGRVILAHKKHVSELIELTDEERNDYFADVAKVARAIHKVFNPDKVNYGAYGDTGHHLHFHIVPKYKGGEEWGSTFEMNSGRTILTDAEYEEMAEAIRQALKEV